MTHAGAGAAGYAELHVATGFSFLEGASHPEELVECAAGLGLAAIGVTDRNTLAGAVQMWSAARARDLRFVLGCRLELACGTVLLAWPTDRGAYGRLCRLLTRGKRRAAKGDCLLHLDDVAEFAAGQRLALLPGRDPRLEPAAGVGPAAGVVAALREQLADARLYLAAHHHLRGDDRRRIGFLDRVAHAAGVPLIATNEVRYHAPDRRPLADVVACIRAKCRIDEAGFLLAANAERHLKAPAEMARLFAGHEHALAATLEIVEACAFDLSQVAYEYPEEPVPPGLTPQEHLTSLAWAGAARHWPDGVPPAVAASLSRELAVIAERGLARYFLTVHDVVAWARAQEPPILCQGRGSAANSAVCFCLGVTNVDPTKINLLFERFLSSNVSAPPDIDVDFEHERREEVIQHIYRRYGRDRAGLAATVVRYRPRSAIREVGKVLGLSEDVTRALAGTAWGSWGHEIERERAASVGVDLADPHVARAVDLANALIGMPRHLSQHVGGFVVTRGLLEETVPIGNAAMDDRTFIEWDKDDIDALGIFKIDVLALGMLTCIAKSFDLIARHHGRAVTLATVPPDDPRVYDMLCRADSLGVFQVESRAQMNMLPRLKPRCFYDLVIEVAIVRPGPIQGDMVHPYLRRRDGLEAADIPSPRGGDPDELRHILGRTLGVPLFQEQAMSIALTAAGFTTREADELRHAMATFRKRGTIGELEEKLVGGLVRRGYEPDFARRCFNQIKGFGEYGFPESHAASFAHLVYVSSWIKHHHPDVFCAALLNAQPMGFYAPAQIVRDAREHGVEVRPPCINASEWDCTLETAAVPQARATATIAGRRLAVRLGLRLIDGLGEAAGRWIASCRDRDAPYRDLDDLRRRTELPARALDALARADALAGLGLDRRAALWAVEGLPDAKPLPLFAAAGERREEPAAVLPPQRAPEQVVDDYRATRLSLRGHPVGFLREDYARRGIVPCEALPALPNRRRVHLAGVVLVRQKPGSAKGVMFITLEDETGIANIVVWPHVMERFRPAIMGARLMIVEGRIERLDAAHAPRPLYQPVAGSGPAVPIIHVVADRIVDASADLARLSDAFAPVPLARADEVRRPLTGSWRRERGHPRDARVVPKSRDFH